MRVCFLFVLSAYVVACLSISPAKATSPSLSGGVAANFVYHPDNPDLPGDQSYWSWNDASGSLTLSIPSVIDTTIKPAYIGPTAQNWTNAAMWTQPQLDTSGLFVGQNGSGSFNYSVNYGSSTLDVFRGFGPREDADTFSQVDITNASGAGEPLHYPDFDTVQSNHATSKFNVTIPSGVGVHNDQFQVIVENLTVQSGGAMLDPLAIVRHDVVNHGSGTFGGTVQGNFSNDAIALSGNTANVNGMILQGQLQNTGELYITGILQTQTATANAGSIFLNDNGQLKANAAFTNNGSISILSANASVSGTGTFTNNGPFQWTGGQITSGTGFFNNSNAFSMSGSSSKNLIEPFTNSGTVTQSGGGDFDIGSGNTISNLAGALYNITDDSSISIAFGGGSVSNSGTFRKSGGTGTSSIGVPLTNSGTLAPNSGTLSFTDTLTLNSLGTLAFQLRGSTASTDYGKLYKPGNLTLAGALQIMLGPGFMPALGNSFDLIDWGGPGGGSLSGAFDFVRLPPLASGLKWDTSQLYTDGSLSIGVGIPGDFDENGVVEAADYVIWHKYLNTIYSQSDYGIWRSHFGQSAPGAGSISATSIPEPSTITLLVLTVCSTAPRRRVSPKLVRLRALWAM
jgi:hypothetical protein